MDWKIVVSTNFFLNFFCIYYCTAGRPAIGGTWSLVDMKGRLVTEKTFQVGEHYRIVPTSKACSCSQIKWCFEKNVLIGKVHSALFWICSLP